MIRSRSVSLPLIVMAVAILIFGLAGLGRFALARADNSTSSDSSDMAVEPLPLSQYGSIPLPQTAPPAGAHVVTAGWEDPVTQGQSLSFEYNGFTIGVCAITPTTTAPRACSPQPGQTVFRDVWVKHTRVLFTTYSKLNAEDLPAAQASALNFFKSSDLALRPAWLPSYAASYR